MTVQQRSIRASTCPERFGKGAQDSLDTTDAPQLAFYASYHSNIINKAIHLICIPLIYWWVQVE
jgi:hypothetical protein